jgi:hypothetical protein
VPPPPTTSTANGMCRWLAVRIAQHNTATSAIEPAKAERRYRSTWYLRSDHQHRFGANVPMAVYKNSTAQLEEASGGVGQGVASTRNHWHGLGDAGG